MVPGTGLLAACVPGTFESWMLLLRDYGTMRLRDVLEPAIAYARDGYPLVERASATIKTVEQLFRKHWPTSAAVYLPNGEVPKPGTLFTNKQLSETYARILKEAESAGSDRAAQIERARKTWSHGFVAEAIDKFCRTQEVMDVSGSPHKGVLSADDMARWEPTIEAPLTYEYGRYTVCKAGVWSQGPVMLQQLALLKGFQLDGLDPAGPEFIHLQVECAKLAFADREKFYGDPKFTDIPIATLLSDAYNDERRKLISDKSLARFHSGLGRGLWCDRQTAPRRRQPRGRRRHGRGRADGRAFRRGARRYRAFRHHRPGRQHDLGHAVRRLAAILARDSRTRLLPRQPRADVLAGGKPPGSAGAGQASAHHAVADDRAARRRAVSRLGIARRRPAGSVDHAILPAARPCQTEFAGSDRRAGVAFRAFPDLVLAAHRAARRARGREPRAEGDRSIICNAAATSSRPGPTGRKAASPPPPRLADAVAPPPIRGACKATRPGDNQR